ncbi:hypothetical protein BDD12DRAFT_886286 [Trichophaea hybrida]|nr:hypothetical protein BDD12DRAFT_886286 [Trichophaea hybrida]
MWDYDAFIKEEAFEGPQHHEEKGLKDFSSTVPVSLFSENPNNKSLEQRQYRAKCKLSQTNLSPKSPSMSTNENQRQLAEAMALQRRINAFNSLKKLHQSAMSGPRNSEGPPRMDEEWSDEGNNERMQPKQ